MVGGCWWNSAKRNPLFFPGEREKELLQRFRQSESGKRFPFPPSFFHSVELAIRFC